SKHTRGTRKCLSPNGPLPGPVPHGGPAVRGAGKASTVLVRSRNWGRIPAMSTTHRVRLGKTELMVSPICYGTWQLSPRFWGPVEERPVLDAMRRAFEVGVNFFDTANAYGDGLGEEVLGRGVKDLPRDQIVIATKGYWHILPDGRRFGD